MFGLGKLVGSGEVTDADLRAKKMGPYSLPPEDNGDPRAVYVENSGIRYRLSILPDFIRFRDACLSDEGWTERHRQPKLVVMDRPAPTGGPGASLNLVKVTFFMPNVVPRVMYDALHDPDFRRSWDDRMIEGFNICHLDDRNDIGYYSATAPWPLASREFVNKRCWMEFTNGEFIIFNHSVVHNDYPVTPKYVRGLSYVSGYYLSPMTENEPNSPGCRMIFYTHANPEGNIPHTLINMAYTKMCPAMVGRLEDNCEKYLEFAKKQGRHSNFIPPWRTPPISWDEKEGETTPGDSGSLSASAAAAASSSSSEEKLKDSEKTGDEKRKDSKTKAASDDEDNFEEDELLLDRLNSGSGSGSKAAGDVVLKKEILELKKRIRMMEQQHLLSGEGSSLAPAGQRKEDDPESVQQFRAMLDDALNFVDRQYLHEGRSPTSVAEYLLRLHAIVDGVRRTLHEQLAAKA